MPHAAPLQSVELWDRLKLSKRARHGLQALGIVTAPELLATTPAMMRRQPGIGDQVTAELVRAQARARALIEAGEYRHMPPLSLRLFQGGGRPERRNVVPIDLWFDPAAHEVDLGWKLRAYDVDAGEVVDLLLIDLM